MNEIVLLSEEKIANRLVGKLGLVPPINIVDLVKRYAEYEEDFLPLDVDAICLQRKNEKPLVIIDRFQAPRRKRFTLAHELGHLVIPWHTGTMICHTEGYSKYDDYSYSQIESEANRFASEVLMPSPWIQGILDVETDLERVVNKVVTEADVSVFAAIIAITKNLPKGVLILLSQGSTLINDLRSPGTKISLNKEIDIKYISSLSSDFGEFNLESYEIHWFRFDIITDSSSIENDNRLAKEVLKDIISSCYDLKEEQNKITQSINGIFGAAYSRFSHYSKEEFYLLIKQRIASHSRLKTVVTHSEFETFLQKKITELIDK